MSRGSLTAPSASTANAASRLGRAGVWSRWAFIGLWRPMAWASWRWVVVASCGMVWCLYILQTLFLTVVLCAVGSLATGYRRRYHTDCAQGHRRRHDHCVELSHRYHVSLVCRARLAAYVPQRVPNRRLWSRRRARLRAVCDPHSPGDPHQVCPHVSPSVCVLAATSHVVDHGVAARVL